MGKFKPVTAANSPALLKCDSEDHISKLPNDVLVAILCLLTCKEAAATSVLSRRWVDLWKSKSTLDFDAIEALERVARDHTLRAMARAKYISSVNQVLTVHEGSVIDEFRICFDLSNANKLDIDNWLKFAFARTVQRLELDLGRWGFYPNKAEETYAFPLASCGGMLSTFVDFKPLKSLSFNCVNVTGDTLEFFLSNCPFLERLQVCNSAGLVNLEVSGPSLRLRYLMIVSCMNLGSIKIFNTNLVKLRFRGEVDALFLDDLPFLTDAWIGRFKFPTDVFAKFSSCLSKLEVLSLSFERCISHILPKELKNLPRLPKLKQLTLATCSLIDSCLLECASLVHAFPNLQKLVIHLWWGCPCSYRTLQKIQFRPHKSLKLVKLEGYYGRTSDLELAMYFLKNAIVLEELVIDPRVRYKNDMHLPKSSKIMEREETARTIAKQHLKRIKRIPPSIKLKIL